MTYQPTPGQQRLMIYKAAERALLDGCQTCNESKVLCDSRMDSIHPRRCCPMCAH